MSKLTNLPQIIISTNIDKVLPDRGQPEYPPTKTQCTSHLNFQDPVQIYNIYKWQYIDRLNDENDNIDLFISVT